MIVEIEEMNPYKQYKVVVDHGDRREYGGYIGYHEGAKFCPTKAYSPRQLEEIEKQLAELTKQDVPGSGVLPDVPPELMKPQTDEDDIDADELD